MEDANDAIPQEKSGMIIVTVLPTLLVNMSWDRSVNKVTGYVLDDQGLIPTMTRLTLGPTQPPTHRVPGVSTRD